MRGKTLKLQDNTTYILLHIGLVFGVALCFRNGFNHFMASDDYNWFFDMLKVLHHPKEYFSVSVSRTFLRPTEGLYFILNILAAGASSFAYHFSAILIHLANTVLVSLWISKICNSREAGLIGALFWGLNYKHTEAVFRPYGVADSLALLFGLVAFLLFLKRRTFLSIISLAFALLAKENAALFPLAIACYVALFIKENTKTWLHRTVPLWGIAFLIAGFGAYHRHNQPGYLHIDVKGIVRFWEIMVSYIGPDSVYVKMLWQRYTDSALFVWIALALSVVFVIALWKLPKTYSFALLFTSVMTLPTVFVPYQTSRYYYIPLVGIGLIVGQGLSSLFSYLVAQNAEKRIVLLAGICVFIHLYFILGINVEEQDYAFMGDLHRQAAESFQQEILPILQEDPERMAIFLKPDSRPLVEAIDRKFREKPWYFPTTYKWIYVRAHGVLGMTNTYAFVTYCAYERNKDQLFVRLPYEEFRKRILAGDYHIIIHDYQSNTFHFGSDDVKAQLIQDVENQNVYRSLQPGHFDPTSSGDLDM